MPGGSESLDRRLHFLFNCALVCMSGPRGRSQRGNAVKRARTDCGDSGPGPSFATAEGAEEGPIVDDRTPAACAESIASAEPDSGGSVSASQDSAYHCSAESFAHSDSRAPGSPLGGSVSEHAVHPELESLQLGKPGGNSVVALFGKSPTPPPIVDIEASPVQAAVVEQQPTGPGPHASQQVQEFVALFDATIEAIAVEEGRVKEHFAPMLDAMRNGEFPSL